MTASAVIDEVRAEATPDKVSRASIGKLRLE